MISANNLAFGLLCKQALFWQPLGNSVWGRFTCIEEHAVKHYFIAQINNRQVFSLVSAGVKMKLIFQSFLYCCLLATVAHCMELEVKPELKKRWVIRGVTESIIKIFCCMWQHSLNWMIFLRLITFLLLQAKYVAGEQTETGCWQCISREDKGVWALCQTGGYQGYFAATFQVRFLQIWKLSFKHILLIMEKQYKE